MRKSITTDRLLNLRLGQFRGLSITQETVLGRPEPTRGGVGPENRLSFPPDTKRLDARG
jgi:hypothetical protein